MNVDANILFYSNYCKLCMNLITILKNENFIKFFCLVCVDDKLDKLPKDMVVPSMRIKGSNRLWVAEETFEWIKQAKFITNVRQRQFITQMQMKNSIAGFNKLEHASKSDKFTFVDNGIDFFSQDYVGKNDLGTVILTPPKEKDSEKIRKNDQDDLIKKIDQLRNDQDYEFKEKARDQQAAILATRDMKNRG